LQAVGGDDRRAQARQLFQSIASVNGFYEQLALEALGQQVTVPARPQPPTEQEQAAARDNLGLQRALYAIGLGLRSEGVREWNYWTNLAKPGGMQDRELLAAAQLACQREVWDRCINTSERTKGFVDIEQRFPTPHRDLVVRRSQEINLDPAYVYGLIRQESRFVTDARSSVGAGGLMQVMPATARWTARKLGIPFTNDQLHDRDTNVAIGTGYLKLVLDDFDGSMALAAAAYNAGPRRPRTWRNGPSMEAAAWAENVPFPETRDYVKKVLANTTMYAAILTGQPQSLQARLGRVGPRDAAQPEAAPDLP
jgi:soluble lytic murein transglycosylase